MSLRVIILEKFYNFQLIIVFEYSGHNNSKAGNNMKPKNLKSIKSNSKIEKEFHTYYPKVAHSPLNFNGKLLKTHFV
jgi:hypothetical protein